MSEPSPFNAVGAISLIRSEVDLREIVGQQDYSASLYARAREAFGNGQMPRASELQGWASFRAKCARNALFAKLERA